VSAGVVLASQLLADTFARAGYWVQSFPEFKAERRGAPISAFLRWDTAPIHRRYKVRECDVLVSIGTSNVVWPATEIPRYALRAGAHVIIVNKDMAGQPLGKRVLPLPGPSGEILPALVRLAFAAESRHRR